jgi:hypothetical protein
VRDFLLKSVTPDFLLIRFPSFSSNSSDPSLRSPDDPAPWKPWKGDSGDFTLGNTEKDVGNQGFSVRKMIWPRLVAFSDLRIYVQEVTRQNLSFCGGGHVSFWFILIHFDSFWFILIHFDSFCNEKNMEDDGFTMGFTGVLLTASIRIELYTFW